MRDLKGCLTPAGIAAFRDAPPGAAAPELAAHVASCARCQDKLLAADEGTLGKQPTKPPPPVWRVFALFFCGLVLAAVLFVWLSRTLSG